MSTPIYPCLWFDNKAKEAAELYCSSFSNAAVKQVTPMVVTFEINGKRFMGLNGGPMFQPNPSISFFTICESEKEIDHAWERLKEGGIVLMALNKYPWSEKYGWVQDKYGISWQLSLTNGKNDHSTVFPTLMFTGEQNGRAEEAINFYVSVFKNSSVDVMAKYEAGEQDTEGNVKHAQFRLDGYQLAAMDSSLPHGFSFNEGISLVVECNTQEEIDYYWQKFTDGGKESMCGWCQDQFGVWWQVVPAVLPELMSDPEKGPRVMAAFMKMKKFDIQTLLDA